MLRFVLSTAVLPVAATFLLVLGITDTTHADTFHLRSGGRLEGNLINPNEQPRNTYRIRLETGGDVTLEARDVSKVVKPTREQLVYRNTLKTMPDTVESHMKVYELCKQLSLTRERTFHLEQAIRIDPDYAPARQLLKYKQKSDGSWAKLEEIKEEAGLVRFGGKWVTQEEARLAELREQREEQQITWKKNIKRWRGWLGDRGRRSKALAAFNAIDDPLAVEPLVKMFQSDGSIAVREMIAEILGRIGTASATKALAQAALRGNSDAENDLRFLCVRLLQKNNRRSVASGFIPELRSSDNAIVRRAGYAIGELGDESAVLPLIKALNTNHTKLVGGKGNGNINAGSGGLSVGRTKAKKVNVSRSNKEVRSALVKLTNQDFEYNERKWLAWYQSKNTPPNYDLRRDP